MMVRAFILGATLASVFTGAASAEVGAQRSNTLSELKFAFDSAALPDDATERLRDVVSFADTQPGARIVLDAHCDPIGTSPYNVGLAIRRAEAVRARLTSMGVPDEQIVFAIYGKDGEHRAKYADDRRVTLWSTRESLAMLSDHTFAGGGTAVSWQQPLTVAQIEAAPEPVARR